MMRCALQLLVCALVTRAVVACPSVCTCAAAQVVCTSRNLASVPTGIPTTSTSVYLTSNQLTSIPATTFNGFTQLQVLSLATNQLSSLPRDLFSSSPLLTNLFLAGNQFVTLPDGLFGNLTRLERLDLSGCQLASLPPALFSDLISVTWLSLATNKLVLLPADIFDSMIRLIELNLAANQLTTILPGTFGRNIKLSILNLHINQLTSLPPGLFDSLSSLTSLLIFNNRLTTFPEGLFKYTRSLIVLYLYSNRLTTLPAEAFHSVPKLHQLLLNNNSLVSLRPGVFDYIKGLAVLDIAFNRLTSLPPGLFNGLNLNRLEVRGNPLLPEFSLCALTLTAPTVVRSYIIDSYISLNVTQASNSVSCATGVSKLCFALPQHRQHIFCECPQQGQLYNGQSCLSQTTLCSAGVIGDCDPLCYKLQSAYLCQCPLGRFFGGGKCVRSNITLNSVTATSASFSWPESSTFGYNGAAFLQQTQELAVQTLLLANSSLNSTAPAGQTQSQQAGLSPDTFYRLAFQNADFNPLYFATPAAALSAAPTLQEATAQSAVSVRVSWVMPTVLDVSAILLGYQVQYQVSGTLVSQTMDVSATQRSLVVGGLKSYTSYTFHVRARTRFGQCPFSNQLSATTMESVPSAAPNVSFLQAVGSSSILITWNSIPQDQANGQLLVYEVRVQGGGSTSAQNASALQNTAVISGLQPNSSYMVDVRAFTAAGPGVYSRQASVTMTSAALPRAPTLQEARAQSSVTVQVSWAMPTLTNFSAILLGYQVQYQISGTLVSQTMDALATQQSLIIGRLKPYTSYTFQVRAQTMYGFGPFSTQLSATTMESVPSTAPDVSFLQAVSSSSILVSWNSIPQDQANGQILVYEVRVQGGGSSNTQNASATQNTVVISGLQPNSSYMVDVRAFTAAGAGMYSQQPRVTMTTAELVTKSSTPAAPTPSSSTISVRRPPVLSSSSSSSSTTVIIVGAALGMVVLILLLLAVVFLGQWRRSQKNLSLASRSSGSVHMSNLAASDDTYEAILDTHGQLPLPPIPPQQALPPTASVTKPESSYEVEGDSPPRAGKRVSTGYSRAPNMAEVRMTDNQAYGTV